MDLALERLAPRHVDRVAAWLSDPAINRWLTEEWRGRTVQPALIGAMMRSAKNEVHVVSTGGVDVGIAALGSIERQDATAMVWYLLGQSALGRTGVMSAAVARLVDLAFREGRFASLYARVIDGNVPSAALLKRVGFREAGRIRNAVSVEGRQFDRIYFDIVPGEQRLA